MSMLRVYAFLFAKVLVVALEKNGKTLSNEPKLSFKHKTKT